MHRTTFAFSTFAFSTFAFSTFASLGLLVILSAPSRLAAQDADTSDAEAQENLLGATNEEDSWRFEEAEGGTGSMEFVEETAVFTVTKTTGTSWHVQVVQTGLELEEGARYKLSFEIKSSDRQAIQVNAMIDEEDWHGIGLQEELYPPTEFRAYEFEFVANSVAEGEKNRISFVLGSREGTVTLKDVSLIKSE